MSTGLTTVSAANLCDATGTKIANATIWFKPVYSGGRGASFELGGTASGAVTSAPVSAKVVNGVFSIVLADTLLTTPANIGYSVTVLDNSTGDSLLGPGYACIQPTGAAWSLDTYIPGLDALQSFIVGAQGPIGPSGGPVGPAGPPGSTGAAGPSAYQVAVANGFAGTQQQWLASLVGAGGASAYQVAVSSGFTGTQQQWLSSLVGAAGPAAGAPGAPRHGGCCRSVGISTGGGWRLLWNAAAMACFAGGAPGGLSAYEIAVAGGFSGTQQQWLSSLIGAAGAERARRPVGRMRSHSQNGFSGTQGAMASRRWSVLVVSLHTKSPSAGGFSGTQQQWLSFADRADRTHRSDWPDWSGRASGKRQRIGFREWRGRVDQRRPLRNRSRSRSLRESLSLFLCSQFLLILRRAFCGSSVLLQMAPASIDLRSLQCPARRFRLPAWLSMTR